VAVGHGVAMTENRLARETSAYLRSAAHQPVQWLPWSAEAFARAKQEDKPVLLDVGAVWCHWCHVLDHESYDDPDVAKIINAHFVAIKVDRDERPDLDARYQHAVGALTGQGGWPLTAFLTPEGKVFFGGTYFPPVDAYGRPSFRRVLLSVVQHYRDNRAEVDDVAGQLQRQLASLGGPPTRVGAVDPTLLAAGIDSIRRAFDPTHGGFGGAPKFPHPSTVDLLVRHFARTREEAVQQMVTRTLQKMARGGVHDQLGGGFHRYATDAHWGVPHFEKMLYDNAGLLSNYVLAYQATGLAELREVAMDTAAFLTEVLMDHRRGGFWGSQDADVHPTDDGSYFTWTIDEAKSALLDEEFAVLAEHYHLRGNGEMHTDPSRHVLFIDRDPDVIAAVLHKDVADVRTLIGSGRGKLLAARERRTAPFVDEACYANWNGMAITAFLQAYEVLGTPEYRDVAVRALERFIQEGYRSDRGVAHVLGPGATGELRLLDDQVQIASALLSAYEVTGTNRYVQVAREITDVVLRDYWDDTGLLDIPRGPAAPGVDTPYKPVQDSPTPSPNGVAALVLLRLSRILGVSSYRSIAERLLQAQAPPLALQGVFASTMLTALDDLLHEPAHVTIVGAENHPQTAALREAALRAFRPDKIISVHSDGETTIPVPEVVRAMIAHSAQPTAYVCAGMACAAPTTDPAVLAETVATFGLT